MRARVFGAAALAALLVVLAGCDTSVPGPTATPDIQATVDAAVTKALAATPTPTPTATPAPSEVDLLDDADAFKAQWPDTYQFIRSLPWVADGLTKYERQAVQQVLRMYDPYEGEPREYDVQRVLSINVDARHYLRVVDSLALTAALAPDNLNRVLAHESLTDGITDREAYIISFVGWFIGELYPW